jgi:hypothetical protein
MKRALFTLVALAALTSLVLTSCDGPLQEQQAQGTLTVQVPIMASWISAGLGLDVQAKGPKALAFIEDLYFELWTWDGELVSQGWRSAEFTGDGGLFFFEFSLLADPGDGYELFVEIYNYFESSTDPVVKGRRDGISIWPNEVNWTSVVCQPNMPIWLDEAEEPFANTVYPADIWIDPADPSIMEFYYSGGEHWYEISPTTNFTQIQVSPDAESWAMFAVYHGNGDMVGDMTMVASFPMGEMGPEDPYAWVGDVARLWMPTGPGRTYYVCVIAFTTADPIRGVDYTIDYFPATASDDGFDIAGDGDGIDDNDTSDLAVEIAEGKYNGVDVVAMDEDWFFFDVFSPPLDEWGDEIRDVTIQTPFDHAQGDLNIIVWTAIDDGTGTMVPDEVIGDKTNGWFFYFDWLDDGMYFIQVIPLAADPVAQPVFYGLAWEWGAHFPDGKGMLRVDVH